mmetsp:Transcript_41613/g.120663  ORF Transcript_41613/g.120663 Transcript_41613/m.120663 type:complete len:308 (-) Transcript_41613:42-965(-)
MGAASSRSKASATAVFAVAVSIVVAAVFLRSGRRKPHGLADAPETPRGAVCGGSRGHENSASNAAINTEQASSINAGRERDHAAGTHVIFGVGDPSAEELAWATKLVGASAAGHVDEVLALLSRAPSDGDADSLQRLLRAEAHLEATSWVNITSVGAAALKGHAEVIEVLLAARADPDAKCQNASSWDGAFTLTQRDTALCIAAKEGHKACVLALLDARADPNVQCDSEYFEGAVEWGENDDGTETMVYSAFDVAKSNHQPEIAEIIKSQGEGAAGAHRAERRECVHPGWVEHLAGHLSLGLVAVFG